jgi:hypothetical protein
LIKMSRIMACSRPKGCNFVPLVRSDTAKNVEILVEA